MECVSIISVVNRVGIREDLVVFIVSCIVISGSRRARSGFVLSKAVHLKRKGIIVGAGDQLS